MRRADRLAELIQILRDGRLHRAHDMARRLRVSARTVYRDMDTLIDSGIPVEGARGHGYRMTAPVTLPPLNLTLTELEALHLGLAAVAGGGDDELRAAARSLSDRVDAALPEETGIAPRHRGFAVHPFSETAGSLVHLPAIRQAIRSRQKLRVAYSEPREGQGTDTIRPLKLDYWGRVWTLTAWSEGRADFRVLRCDRIARLTVVSGLFVEERGKTLADFRERQDAETTRTPTAAVTEPGTGDGGAG